MSITYFQTRGLSDLSGPDGTGGATRHLIADRSPGDPAGASNLSTGNMNPGVNCNQNFFTPSGDPGADGDAGNFTVVIRFSTQNANIGVQVFLARVNSSGTVQGSEVQASQGSQTAGAATRTYTWTSPGLGTWGAGDRLRVRVFATNISGSMNQSCVFGVDTEDDTIDTPFTAVVLEPVGRSAGLGWNLHGVVGRSAETTWNIQVLSSEPVGRSAGLGWDLRGVVGRSAGLGWNVEATVTGSTFLDESFTAADDTFITALDANWEEMPWDISGGTTANRPLVFSNRYRPHTANEPCRSLRWNVDPGADEYDVTASWNFQALQLGRQLAIFVRMTPSGSAHGDMSYYRIACHGSTSPAFFIHRVVDGASTQLATESVSLTGGTPIAVRVEVRAAGIEVYVDDSLLLSTDDTTITQRGRVGIGGHRGDGTGNTPLMDDLLGTSAAAPSVGREAELGWDVHQIVGRSAAAGWDAHVTVGRDAGLGWDTEALDEPTAPEYVQSVVDDNGWFRVNCTCHWRSRRWPTADLAAQRERHHFDMHDTGEPMPRAHLVWDGRGFEPPSGGNGAPSEPRSVLTQHGLSVTFDDEYPTGQFVSGDWWVVGSPTVVSTDPAWDGSRHGTTINPGLHISGYHVNMGYDADKNIGHQLPFQLEPGDTIIHTHGWLASDPEVQALGITVTANPAAPRPCIRDSMIITVLDEAPPAGSFRPPYVAGPKWMYNTSQLDWDLLANVAPLGNAPSWEAVQASIGRPWAPDAGYGPTTSRYLHPYFHMPDYGRDLCAQMYRAILLLNTDATQQQKEFTLHRVVQYGIDTLAITRLADEETFRISGAATSLGSWWADFGGGHGVGRDLPALLAKKILDDPTELQAAWDVGPRYWGDMGQIWVSDGTSADPFRSVGDATWGERAHTRSSTNPGTTGYRTCCTTVSVMGGMLAAHLMGVTAEWDHADAPITEYVDWYVDTDRASDGTSQPRAYYPWFASMWDTYRGGL